MFISEYSLFCKGDKKNHTHTYRYIMCTIICSVYEDIYIYIYTQTHTHTYIALNYSHAFITCMLQETIEFDGEYTQDKVKEKENKKI